MSRPPLSAEDRAAWARLVATARPLVGGALADARPHPSAPPAIAPFPGGRGEGPAAAGGEKGEGARPVLHRPADTLDGGWDRRLRRGAIQPDRMVDLHGHTLASAHAAVEAALANALAADLRVLLVVTGKPPRAGDGRRGLIRAGILDWLAHSRHAARIAAIRNAHPRHGGAGALYVILRRTRAR